MPMKAFGAIILGLVVAYAVYRVVQLVLMIIKRKKQKQSAPSDCGAESAVVDTVDGDGSVG